MLVGLRRDRTRAPTESPQTCSLYRSACSCRFVRPSEVCAGEERREIRELFFVWHSKRSQKKRNLPPLVFVVPVLFASEFRDRSRSAMATNCRTPAKSSPAASSCRPSGRRPRLHLGDCPFGSVPFLSLAASFPVSLSPDVRSVASAAPESAAVDRISPWRRA